MAAPWKTAEVFLVVEVHHLAAFGHQALGDFLVGDGEFEGVRLHAGGLCLDAGLDELAFVGFPDDTLVDDVVEFAAAHAFAEDEVEAEVAEDSQSCDEDGENDPENFFHITEILQVDK